MTRIGDAYTRAYLEGRLPSSKYSPSCAAGIPRGAIANFQSCRKDKPRASLDSFVESDVCVKKVRDSNGGECNECDI